jgi:hypothetical protein
MIYISKGVFMKYLKNLFLFGMLYFIFFVLLSCNDNAGTLTITGFPDIYNGKWIYFRGDYYTSENNKYIYGAKDFTITEKTRTATLFQISNNRINIPIWLSIADESKRYSGNDTFEGYIIVLNTQTINFWSDFDTDKVETIFFEDIKFSKGNAILALEEAVKRFKNTNSERNNTVVETFNNEDDFNVILTNDNTGVIITSYVGTRTAVNIPPQIQGFPVKEIGFNAFDVGLARKTNTKITSVVIPSGVTKIGESAFLDQNRLTSVTIPPTVIYIGWGAFSQCSQLTSITLPHNITKIENHTFSKTGLTTIIIPEGVTLIEDNAFKDCKSLLSVTFPSTIKQIGRSFSNCSSLTTLIFPETVNRINWNSTHAIPYSAFDLCPKIPIATQARLKQLGYTGNF